MKVEIWSDVVCPWCFIGKRRFDKAVARLRERGITDSIEVVFRSFQLDPGAPEGATMPAVEGYARKFGGPERAAQIVDHVTRIAAEDGIEFHMDIALRANTLLAHRALHWAKSTSGSTGQADMKERLLGAYFTGGLDVGDIEVVVACADDAGLDGASLRSWLDAGGGFEEVAADIEGAASREITAVPSFVIDDRFLIPGAQDVDVYVNVLEKMLSR